MICFISLFIISCKFDNSGLMPNVTGKAGEVVVVMEKFLWEGNSGTILSKYLSSDVAALPQGEPMVDLVNIPRAAFSNIFKTHRNLIITTVSKNIKESKITVRNDVYAKPQIVIKIEASSSKQLEDILEKQGENIISRLVEKERDRIINNYRKYEEPSISHQLRSNHNLSMILPRGYKCDVDTNNFVWISHETNDIIQGIFIYYYDYTDTSSFNKENLISKRDKILKQNVPGPVEGSYMTTEKNMPISYREFMLNKRYTTEIGGLWKLDGPAYMGGPFISMSTVDETYNRIITVEGFVFAPKLDKRNYLRQVEAILHTLRIIEPEEKLN